MSLYDWPLSVDDAVNTEIFEEIGFNVFKDHN